MRSRRVQGPAGRVDLPVPARQTGKTCAVHFGQQWVSQSVQRFVYDDWSVVMVLDENNTTVRKYTLDTPPRVVREGSRRDPGAWPLAASQGYTWGLDLSRLIHGAGGIGGLLAVEETATTGSPSYWFLYDANGNVGQVIQNTTGYPTVAQYEYDPYGNVIASSGSYAAANPIRFSTKWFDTELASTGTTGATGLDYWGYRYYSPRLGRWISRDPIDEQGGTHLYSFIANMPTAGVDSLGTIPIVVPVAIGYGIVCLACAQKQAQDVFNEHQGKDDSFLHCVTVCRIKRKCPPGTAATASIVQEIPPSTDWTDDLEADAQGMCCGSWLCDREWGVSCEACCSKNGYPPSGNQDGE